MSPLLSRYLVLPLHERLVGRATLRYARELRWSQWAAPDDVRELQRRKLADLLRHAAAHTPFYARRLAEAGISLADLAASAGTTPGSIESKIGTDNADAPDPFALLRLLPPLSKDEIRASLGEMLWHDTPGGLHPYNTGGSTGEPLSFYIDRRRQAYDQAARIRTHAWFGAWPGDRELFLWGSPIERRRSDRLRRLRDRLFNQRLLDAFNMSEASMERYVAEWNRFRPHALFGYPSSIARFVAFCRERGLTVWHRRPAGDRRAETAASRASTSERKAPHVDVRNLRAVFVTGEVCFPHDRRAIEEFFQVPVADGYGSREAGFIAHQCPEGSMHITAENLIVEILREGRPVPAGESGEIVITHLDAYAMPLIRYRTGDHGRLIPGRCRCGRGLPLMDVVQGRSTDFLYLPDGNVRHALSIIYPLRELPGIRQFRVTQNEDYSVVVDVVPASGTPTPLNGAQTGVTREAVIRRLRPVVGENVALDVRCCEEIRVVESGKFRYVTSQVTPSPGVRPDARE